MDSIEITEDDVIKSIEDNIKGLTKFQRVEFIRELIEILDPEVPLKDVIAALESARQYVY